MCTQTLNFVYLTFKHGSGNEHIMTTHISSGMLRQSRVRYLVSYHIYISDIKRILIWFNTFGPEQNVSLQWRHNGRHSVSNHQPHDCFLNRLFRRRSKKTSKLCVTGLCAGNSPGPVNSPHKWPVTRKMFPFDDVIMWYFADGIFKCIFRLKLLIFYWKHISVKSVIWNLIDNLSAMVQILFSLTSDSPLP